ncbi:MAG: hypothetical protein VCA12_04585 [Pseudomonadales bacterium]
MPFWKFVPCLTLIFFAAVSHAKPFAMDLYETEDVRILYFGPAQTYLVPHLSRSFHNSLQFQKTIFDWQPWEKTTLVLSDLSDYGNAGAGVSPGNSMLVDIAPLNRTLEILPGSERTFMVMNHELVHVATMDNWNNQDSRWRKFFRGKPIQSDKHPESILYNYLTAPRRNTPRWYTEGSAVFLDTWMSGGIGRAQGAYDEMVFRSMVRDDAHFYSNLGIVSEGIGIDFQVGINAYLYGTRFISYLAYEYSPEQVLEWLGRDQDSERNYAKQFARVFSSPLETQWGQWITWEKSFQAKNLSRVRQTPLTPNQPITKQAMGSMARGYLGSDEKTLISGFRYPGVVAHVGIIDIGTGTINKITDIKGPNIFPVTSTAYDQESETFFFTEDNGSYRELMSVNLDSREKRLLLKDARIGDIAFNRNDKSIWGLRHLNGFVSLVRVPFPYDNWNEIHTWAYGEVPYELDVSADGALVSMSKADVDGTQYLQIFKTNDLIAGKAEPLSQFDFGTAVPEGFVFSPEGKYLFGSSFYTGVSNIFRFEWGTGELEAVSNAETGFFRPIPKKDGSLIVYEYTGQGFIPTVINPEPLEDVSAIVFLGNEIAKKHPVVRDWSVVKSLKESKPPEQTTTKTKYRPARELGLNAMYPVIEGYRDDQALGWHINFADPAQFHQLELTASYTIGGDAPSDEKLHVNLEYSALNWHARYWHNDADFYDLFGPTEYARKGDAYMIGYKKTLIYDSPRELRFTADLEYYTGLDTLPANQNVAAVLFEDVLAAEFQLDYSNTRKSLGAVDHEKGFAWHIAAGADEAEGDIIPRVRLGLDAGLALPLKHSSVWLYTRAGMADGDRLNPLTNFYFGGFGNNYVDNGDIKRYRQYDSMPGFDIGDIGAKNFAKTLLEWNLPPIRFREVGRPGLFLSWVRPALFAGVLWTDPNNSQSRTLKTVGAQVDLQFNLAHRLPMTLSLGYAVGLESGQPHESEWMLSLKVL